MATQEHNRFLDADHSEDDEDRGYDSEIDQLRKGGRSSKRRKIESDHSDDEQSLGNDSDDEDLGEAGKGVELKQGKQSGIQSEEDEELPDDGPSDGGITFNAQQQTSTARKAKDLPNVSRPLMKKNLVATEKAIKKSGVVYISRVPPFMKPAKLRSLLEPYGVINRIFLTPEDPLSHTKRVRNGGNKKRSFADGWVEFVNKAEAKQTCELLNAKTIGGKKGSYYHDDVWNLIYLKGFKWNNLTEQIAAENAERASRMRAEISQTTKQNKDFLQNVERAKMLEGMEAKKAAKRIKEGDFVDQESKGDAVVKEPRKGGERPRKFKQTQVAVRKVADKQPEEVKRVLSKIF